MACFAMEFKRDINTYYSGSETSPRSSNTFPSLSLVMKPLSVQIIINENNVKKINK